MSVWCACLRVSRQMVGRPYERLRDEGALETLEAHVETLAEGVPVHDATVSQGGGSRTSLLRLAYGMDMSLD